MRPLSPAIITAALTALVTIGLIALLFFLPGIFQNSDNTEISLEKKTENVPALKADTPARNTTLMSLDRLAAIIIRLDNKVENSRKGLWRFTISGATVVVVADDEYDRLRILVGIQSAKELTQEQLIQITQSNFDTALDARYAISQDILWAIYVHPLKSIADKQFISAIGQTVNLAKSYGDGYSSGGILFEGGDDKDSRRNQMIEELIKKGLKT